MAIIVDEKFDSRETTDDKAELLYFVKGTDDNVEAIAALKAAAPLTHDGKVRDECSIEWLGLEEWLATVVYLSSSLQQPTAPQTGESVFSFDTGGGTQHITQAISHVASYVLAGKTAEDFKGAIGVGGDGDNITVEGVEIVVPVYNFAETHYMDDSLVTMDYRLGLVDLTGKTNLAPFRNIAAGDVLFLGASGSKRGGGDWEITFRFAASPTKTNIAVGDITVPKKEGWQYMWVRYATKRGSKRYVRQPIQVCIDKVYHSGNYSALRI